MRLALTVMLWTGVVIAAVYVADRHLQRETRTQRLDCGGAAGDVLTIHCVCPSSGPCDCTCRIVTSRGKQ